MEETLGKRIAFHRKRLGLTQDALAEQLGVTAQAVSKWENDQSCPDISMLPKLAEIFGVTTDALLGVVQNPSPAEIVSQETEPDTEYAPPALWNPGFKFRIGLALWLLLSGVLCLINNKWGIYADPSHLFWSSGLMLFGLFGLYPRFSMFRTGCALFGAYWLAWYLGFLPNALTITQWETVLPTAMLLFGVCLLVDGLLNPRKGPPSGHRFDGSSENHCIYNGETFDCITCFGSGNRQIQLPRLTGGCGEVTFGELILDLSRCVEIADGCEIALKCAFGSLEILVPRKYRVEAATSSAFGAVDVKGSPDPDAQITIYLKCNVSFGQIAIRYM